MSSSSSCDQSNKLTLGDLVSAPLVSAAQAQGELSRQIINFIEQVGMTFSDDSTSEKEAVMLSFDLERSAEDENANLTTQRLTIQAPILCLVPIPALSIDEVTVDFTAEVKDYEESLDDETSSSYTTIAKVAASREHTRTTDKTAKYHVSVKASRMDATEGMNRLLDIFATAVEPIQKTESSSGSNDSFSLSNTTVDMASEIGTLVGLFSLSGDYNIVGDDNGFEIVGQELRVGSPLTFGKKNLQDATMLRVDMF